jgi:hypothetical protein
MMLSPDSTFGTGFPATKRHSADEIRANMVRIPDEKIQYE